MSENIATRPEASNIRATTPPKVVALMVAAAMGFGIAKAAEHVAVGVGLIQLLSWPIFLT